MRIIKLDVICYDCGKKGSILLEKKRLFRIVKKSNIISAWGYFGALKIVGGYIDIWECPDCMLENKDFLRINNDNRVMVSVDDKSKGKVIGSTCTTNIKKGLRVPKDEPMYLL